MEEDNIKKVVIRLHHMCDDAKKPAKKVNNHGTDATLETNLLGYTNARSENHLEH